MHTILHTAWRKHFHNRNKDCLVWMAVHSMQHSVHHGVLHGALHSVHLSIQHSVQQKGLTPTTIARKCRGEITKRCVHDTHTRTRAHAHTRTHEHTHTRTHTHTHTPTHAHACMTECGPGMDASTCAYLGTAAGARPRFA